MSLTQGALEGDLQDTFLSLLCLLTYFPRGSKPEYSRMENEAQGGLWSGDPALPPSCFLVSLTKSIRWSHSGSTAQGWPSTLRARCSRATDPALEGALRTSMKEITRGELQGVQRKEAPMPEAMAVNKYFRCWANHANPN